MKARLFMVLTAVSVLFSSCGETAGTRYFEPYVIEGLEPKPDFWKVRPDEIMDFCRTIKKGRVERIATTPLGFPVNAVFYGDFSEGEPATNFSAGNSSSALSAYLGRDCDAPQTIMFIAGVHGSEPENVAAAMNMLKLLETGCDFRGRSYPEFLELASRYRIIIVPCVNMDGRSIAPDHFRGQEYETFRGCSQGWWKDGTLIGWMGSKEWFPLPLDKVSFPGGYPNSEGYNIMHDVSPADIRTEEAAAVYKLMSRWRVDFLLNGHSCEYEPFMVYPSSIDTPEHVTRGSELCTMINNAFYEAGLRRTPRNVEEPSRTINMTNMTEWCSGGLGLTLENYHGCADSRGVVVEYSFDQLMEPAFIALTVVMREGLVKPLAGRR